MPFDAGSLRARLQLDTKEFTSGLQSGVASTQKFDSAIGNIFKGGLAVSGITFLTKKVFDFANSAATIATMKEAFEHMAGGAIKANSILDQTRSITKALADKDLMRAANQLELLGVGMKNLPRFVQIARSAAIGLGQDMGYMLESLSTGTARQSKLWLDNLGIIISVEDANEKYAKSLGKLSKNLTDAEERAAFLFAVLEHGQEVIDTVGANAETSAEKLQSYSAYWQNLTDMIKEETLPVFTAWIDLMNKMKEMGVPTGPVSAWAMVKKFGQQLDEWQQKLHQMFPNIFAAGGGGRGAGLTPTNDYGQIDSPSRVTAGMRGGVQGRRFANAMSATAGAGGISPYGQKGMGGERLSIDWGEVDEPILTLGERLTNQFELAHEGLQSLADGFSGFFEMLITDSDNAGRAFFSGLMSGLSGVASKMGDLFIAAGTGIESLKILNGFAAIAAGLALKAVSGIMRGVAVNNAPISSYSPRSTRNPLGTGSQLEGSVTIVVNGDFVGDRVWVDRLMTMIRTAQRNRGAPSVVYAG